LISVQRQIVRAHVVYLSRPRVDVAGWDDEVGVVGELAQLVAGSHRLQITRVDHIRRRSDTGSLDNARSDGLQRRRLTMVNSTVRMPCEEVTIVDVVWKVKMG